MRINWIFEDLIIGDIGEALAAELKQRGQRLRFIGWNSAGQAQHIIRRYA
ncbi:hypothetical protein [Aquitalea aquatilis]|nr:hypothetical protein [Aquitalea aquatilis]